MKKLVTICLACVCILLTTAASQARVSSTIIDFNENGVGQINGTTPLVWGMGIPLLAGERDQYATLYYELPSPVVEGDLVLYESSQVSDVLRFVNVGETGNLQGRVYVYSDLPEKGELPKLADTGTPYDFLYFNDAGMDEQGTENDWNGVAYTPISWTDDQGLLRYLPGYMSQYGDGAVTYNFTSDIPEPTTICMLGLGALSLIRSRRKNNNSKK